MERFNPFASSFMDDKSDNNQKNAFDNAIAGSPIKRAQQQTIGSKLADPPATPPSSSKYSVSFPDPFDGQEISSSLKQTSRSNSVNFSGSSHSVDEPSSSPYLSGRQRQAQASGLSSLLSRATSVTSSSMSDRVSGAVGSVKNAVDSISSQLQQAVPSGLNERISSTADQLQQQQQSTASYLASKLSSATGQFSSSNQSSGPPPIQISRQRVILILDSYSNTDWPHHFNQYRRALSGQGSSHSALTSFFSSATAQLAAANPLSLSSSVSGEAADLVEQADYRDVSVLANQSSSSATVYIAASSRQTSSSSRSVQSMPARIVRPEFVVVKQRCSRDKKDHLKSIVSALNYCLVPLFEPIEVWNIFQDRQMIFASLLRVQRTLGKENFPLIPQVYCQTQQDLLNYISSSSVVLPCLVRMGNGRIKIDNLQGLRDFASIMATSNQSCTIEQYLEVKCDLMIQKLGSSLKLFKKTTLDQTSRRTSNLDLRESASRQTSIGMLTSLISNSSSSTTNSQQSSQQPSPAGLQQDARRDSNSATYSGFERSTEVGSRYRGWMDALTKEFDNKLDMFALNVCVATNDREYVVGLTDCSSEFVGSAENQDEDRRNFVELVTDKVNTLSPKSQVSRNSSVNTATSSDVTFGEKSSNDKSPVMAKIPRAVPGDYGASGLYPLGDKKKFVSQSQIDGPRASAASSNRSYGQLTSRSLSVFVNQGDFDEPEQSYTSKPSYLSRRSSERTDSSNLGSSDDVSAYTGARDSLSSSTATPNSSLGAHQRQASLGQSFFDQTSTAISSFQKQSLSFFKRLDSRSGFEFGTSTPPQSAKSDKAFDRSFTSAGSNIVSSAETTPREPSFMSTGTSQAKSREGLKSQSVDVSATETEDKQARVKPPKPPPPMLSMYNRQSSLATYSRPNSSTTPTSTPINTRQNSSATISSKDADVQDGAATKQRVIRQNSALSAFEALDQDYSNKLTSNNGTTSPTVSPGNRSDMLEKPSNPDGARLANAELLKKSTNYDSASITSGDSNSTTTAEDTMNNLKKTFASIFGDKCE